MTATPATSVLPDSLWQSPQEIRGWIAQHQGQAQESSLSPQAIRCLHRAITEGHEEAVIAWLDWRFPSNLLGAIFQYAVKHGHLDAVRAMFEGQSSDNHRQAMTHAISHHQLSVLEYLVKQPACQEHLGPALRMACKLGVSEPLRLLAPLAPVTNECLQLAWEAEPMGGLLPPLLAQVELPSVLRQLAATQQFWGLMDALVMSASGMPKLDFDLIRDVPDAAWPHLRMSKVLRPAAEQALLQDALAEPAASSKPRARV